MGMILDIFSRDSADSLLTILSKDHDRLKDMLEQILDEDTSPAERVSLFASFKAELVSHSKAEEKVLYRRMEKLEKNRADILEGFVEHEVAESLLNQLAAARQKSSDKWTARCTVLQEALEHHIEEEENQIFSDAREQFDSAQMEKMGDEFLREKSRRGGTAPIASDALIGTDVI